MTKKEKKEKIIMLLEKFMAEKGAAGSEKIIEAVIREIYSSGFSSVNHIKNVSDAIGIFLKDIIENTFNSTTDSWQNNLSVTGILSLIDMSLLPD